MHLWRHETYGQYDLPNPGVGRWKQAGYAPCSLYTAHQRCRTLWGSASLHSCIKCLEPAQDWAYDGTDPEQAYGQSAKGTWSHYSYYPEFYAPMCRVCHRRSDAPRHVSELKEWRDILQESRMTPAEIRERLGLDPVKR